MHLCGGGLLHKINKAGEKQARSHRYEHNGMKADAAGSKSWPNVTMHVSNLQAEVFKTLGQL